MTHEKPDFVLNFEKPKNTEIKYINGYWYLYERSSYYDSAKKSMHKKSGKLLGKITENGFVKSKQKVDHSLFETIDVVEAGISGYLYQKNRKIMDKLEKHFPDIWKELFAISVMRAVEGPRFKRIQDCYETSCLSVLLPGLHLAPVELTSLLKTLGKRRQAMMDFMKEDNGKLSPYIVFDGHRVISDSETLDTAQMGYDSKRRFKDQVNLVYAFSVSGERCFPYYYKQFCGDVPDISAFSSMIEEAGIQSDNLTILADKGFGSDDNFTLIADSGFKYIIPIKRTDNDSKENLPASMNEYDESFIYNGRAILHKRIEQNDYCVHVYLDTSLLANELSDFTARLNKKNKTKELAIEKEQIRINTNKKRRLTDEQLAAIVPVSFKDALSERIGLGTLTIRTNSGLNGAQVYNLYKRRETIEDFFRSYDGSLDFSASYMRDSLTEEAWLFLNHISSIMAFDVLDEIYLKEKTAEVSLKDFTSTFERIHANRIGGQWYSSKITKKRETFASLFGLDIAGLISEMNSSSAT